MVFLVCIENPKPHATAILAEFDRCGTLTATLYWLVTLTHPNLVERGSCWPLGRSPRETETSSGPKNRWISHLYSVSYCVKARNLRWCSLVNSCMYVWLRSGIKYVRGGEIFELRDEDNVVLNDLSRSVSVYVRIHSYIHTFMSSDDKKSEANPLNLDDEAWLSTCWWHQLNYNSHTYIIYTYM